MYKISDLKLVIIFPSFNLILMQYKINEPKRNVSIGVDFITTDLAIFNVSIATRGDKEEWSYLYL